MKNYKLINNITGWFVFLVATVTYMLTVERTASFWDCGEFIAVSYKLMVPHPPGAPFFLLVGRMFSLLAGDNVESVSYFVNLASVFSSSFTILFLFWTITILVKKMIMYTEKELTIEKIVLIMGCGLIGSLAYTFSDSFWFSAAESEVYAMSSLFTALVFWAILKWEAVADEPDADRWLILIAYFMGLSIGVHLLNLVTIPALGFVYYYRRYNDITLKGSLLTFAISTVIIGVIMVGVIPGLPSIAGRFELFFVNSLGMPFNSGVIFFILLFFGGLIYAVYYSIKKQKVLLNTILLAFSFIIIGYASYAIIIIRSGYNPPIDENDPENVISFVSYLKREQYGDRPLLYGPTYMAELVDQKRTTPLYRKGKDKYEIYDYKIENVWDNRNQTLFPRMYSKDPNHIEAYKRWSGLPDGKKPTMGDNIGFYVKYQLGHMFWRYFMWNFAGRESDIQNASWLMPWENNKDLPDFLARNRGRNNFYMLPLVLGLLGLFFHYKKSPKDVTVVGLLFLFTGILIATYLNQPPIEPRERDYTLVGAFYAFAIWIGIGVFALYDIMGSVLKNGMARAGIATVISLIIPGIMLAEGWDDHNRTGRYHSVDSAKNLLNSCAPNAILFTGGDNDTFPLWNVQEVEGFRTDVRVCNLSLLNTDWYISQMKRKAYDSQPLPISLEFDQFIQGKNDYIPFVENPNVKNGMDLKQYVELVRKDHPALKVPLQSGNTITSLPTKTFVLNIDTAKAATLVPEQFKNNIVSQIVWNIGRGSLEKKDLIILDMIANGNWDRPIYFSTTLSNSNYLNLQEYMYMEGLAYRLLPAKVQGNKNGTVSTDIMYENMTKKFFWRGLDDPNVYYDENFLRFPLNTRNSFYRLVTTLMQEGKKEKAAEVIDYCFKVMPDKAIPYDVYTMQFADPMLKLAQDSSTILTKEGLTIKDYDKFALDLIDVLVSRSTKTLDYIKTHPNPKADYEMEIQSSMYLLNQAYMILRSNGRLKEAEKYEKIFNDYYSKYGNM